jgi:hypothetical protein
MRNKTATEKIIDGIMMGKAFNTFLLTQLFYYSLISLNRWQYVIHLFILMFSIGIHTWNEDRKAKQFYAQIN